jgi:ABC-type dipeptide/oligopeptide/nickel transport system ATPase component
VTATNSSNVVLDINNLVVGLGRKADAHRIIDDLSLQVREGETLCLVGESGSGKSVTSLTTMGLLQKGTLVPSGGSVKLVGEELLTASDRRLRQLRATRMAMIFQEPMTALNPVVPVGRQIDEVLRAHTDLDARARRQKILAMMEHVRLPDVERIFSSYPHRLSGGQRQRIMIAMALVLEPKLLIADEPTTALDVTTQKQILTLIRDLQRDHGTAVLFITHDMGVVAEIADRVAVMRHGRLVEAGPLQDVLRNPKMDYTRNLLSSVPSLVPRAPRPETSEPVVLEANELSKVYRERSLYGKAREVAAASNVTLTLRRAARSASSRKRLRQVDGGTLHRPPDRSDVGRGAAGRPRDFRPVTPAATAASAEDPDHLPGPLPLAQPARHRRRRASRKARSITACRARTRWRGPANCSSWSICRPTPSRAILTSSPAASVSASRSRVRSRSIPTCWWPTRRCPRSTSRCRRRF